MKCDKLFEYTMSFIHPLIRYPMKLSNLIRDPDVLIALPPDELGRRMIPLLAAWPHEGEQLQLVQFLPSRAAGTSHQDYLGYSVDHRRRKLKSPCAKLGLGLSARHF